MTNKQAEKLKIHEKVIVFGPPKNRGIYSELSSSWSTGLDGYIGKVFAFLKVLRKDYEHSLLEVKNSENGIQQFYAFELDLFNQPDWDD